MNVRLRVAGEQDLPRVARLVAAYHAFEGIASTPEHIARAVTPLLGASPRGRLWLIERDGTVVGYAALCFGYSIEFGGSDGMLDEMYVEEAHRGRGIGTAVLSLVADEARSLGLRALHLEVAAGNALARRIYEGAGFRTRAGYNLMTRVL